VAWPEPRFQDNEDGTITDRLTGLIWLKDAACFEPDTWTAALDAVADFNMTPVNTTAPGTTKATHLTTTGECPIFWNWKACFMPKHRTRVNGL
jgi:hypothetical protein